MSKILKRLASFDYFDRPITVLFLTTGSISIPLFATVIRPPVAITSASFILAS